MRRPLGAIACAVAIAACTVGDDDAPADTDASTGSASDPTDPSGPTGPSTNPTDDDDDGPTSVTATATDPTDASADGTDGDDEGTATDDGSDADTGDTGFGECADDVWSTLEACGWPGPLNTGPDEDDCPGGLGTMGDDPQSITEIADDGAVVECLDITGGLRITGQDVTVRNVVIRHDSGSTGEGANGTAVITVDNGASATIENVAIDGMNAVHACIWHQGTELVVRAVECTGGNDGIFTWADTGFSDTTGDNFTIEDSWFHDFTMETANGHVDGFQTEGASHGLIRHNTFQMAAEDNAAIALWNSLRDTSDITVQDNLMTGGGATIYAEDYVPSEADPEGGYSLTDVEFIDNTFSTVVAPCVGSYFIWYSRPQYVYGGGPTDGWHRSGNVVMETGENVDEGNPHVDGNECT